MKNRKAKWTEEEINRLRNIVEEHIQKGETKTAAFKKASESLKRTPAACSYRWNAVLKEKQPIPIPPQQLLLPSPRENATSIDMNQIIEFLTHLKDGFPTEDLVHENKILLEEQNQLKKRLANLEKKHHEKKETFKKLFQKYETFAGLIGETGSMLH